MEGLETVESSADLQTESIKSASGSAAPETPSIVKSAPVSVIQSVPKTNGHIEVEKHPDTNGDAKLTNGGSSEPTEEQTPAEPEETKAPAGDQSSLNIQQPTEQLPAELLQEDPGLTTVASLIDSAEEPEGEETEAPKQPEVAQAAVEEKKSAKELASEWETDEPELEKKEETMPETNMAVETEKTDAEVENKDDSSPRKSGRKVKPTEKVLESESLEEESVEAIAKEIATSGPDDQKKPVKATPKKSGKEPEQSGDEDSSKKARKGRPKKKDLDEKVDNVTKLGNNMYFYTGPGGQDSPPPLTSDDEGEKEKKEEAARKSARPGKGRNPRLEREDEEVEIPKKLPAKPNLNPSWLKSAAKTLEKQEKMEKKTPAKKKVVPSNPATPATPALTQPVEAVVSKEADLETEVEPEVGTRKSVKRSSILPQREASPPKDEELPVFDPEKFTPGYVPQTVKKGDEEYLIVVEGVKDTGLCGKYWGDLTNLPSRRRSKQPELLTPEPGTKVRRGSMSSTGSVETPGKKAPRSVESPVPPKSTKKQVTKPETSKRVDVSMEVDGEKNVEEKTEVKTEEKVEEGDEKVVSEKKKRGRKRKEDSTGTPNPAKKPKSSQSGDDSMAEQSDTDQVGKKKSKGSPEKTTVSSRNAAAVSAALAAGVPAGQQRSVSCVSDTTTQKEVVVECFAPYDDHRWVNIGKERDGMTPDAVQYARALRPPYHLLSFLRIKGHSTKGMSCTDKNTMVFVVLEGEITVILHTTQFNAKKGDSFYIPPKNYYNLINQKAREAELSLIQFQYDGPLPTVSSAAQAQ
ncbi:nucleolar and coiled-body phosphoprotein 1 isoform X2 [Eurytemora carolleeae]|uniref:nucleolar and coiled-body phosphoprotein 1 isoform X2 n=1 Tax=Eurytemora carolleeae TaxID=1294199 RepID=UPI000C78E138|nr:nucleolar and coiled-body phosphoprotein 1 isoform X2 [Eurytemora carolleeae]|eukprot:XP_023338617.1 nucleolar and coiled-body phosphoprotein 1-like isoform X2 [Eurytemora affinis]